MVKEKEQADKRLLTLEIVICVLSSIILFSLIFVASFVQMEERLRILLILIGFVPFIVGMTYAIKIEQVAGYYECAKCNHICAFFQECILRYAYRQNKIYEVPEMSQKIIE